MTALRLFLIVRIAGERVALPAERINAVIECGEVTPVPRAPAHLLGVAALRGRVVTLVDAAAALGVGAVRTVEEAVMMDLDGHAYALAVDAIEDVVESGQLAPAPAGIAPGWRAVATGAIEIGYELLLVIDPEGLLQAPTARAA